MSQSRHYENAPITEAVVDLRVEPVSGLSADTLASVGDGELDEFQGDIDYQSVPPKRSYAVRVVCVEVRKGEPRPFSVDDLIE